MMATCSQALSYKTYLAMVSGMAQSPSLTEMEYSTLEVRITSILLRSYRFWLVQERLLAI
jgi:hypothetical protein